MVTHDAFLPIVVSAAAILAIIMAVSALTTTRAEPHRTLEAKAAALLEHSARVNAERAKLAPPPVPPPPPATGPSDGEIMLRRALHWATTSCYETVFPAVSYGVWQGRMKKIRTCPTFSDEARLEYFVEAAGGWQQVSRWEFHR
jgi:hypothetical protein